MKYKSGDKVWYWNSDESEFIKDTVENYNLEAGMYFLKDCKNLFFEKELYANKEDLLKQL